MEIKIRLKENCGTYTTLPFGRLMQNCLIQLYVMKLSREIHT